MKAQHGGFATAKKHFGQHFLKEPAIAQRIADSLTHHGGYRDVIEVGPGTGALTTHLIVRTDINLTCVEVDASAAEQLRIALPALGNRLVMADFLRADLGAIASGPFAVIGNFPYNISTQIVFKVLEHRRSCTEVVGMFQKEVADRLCAGPGSKTYGITSVLAQAFYRLEHLFNVEPGSFIPPPKVRSAVIRMQRNDVVQLPCDERLFFSVVKAAFGQRRKTLHNALKAHGGFTQGVPERFARLRAEQLGVEEFVELTGAAEIR